MPITRRHFLSAPVVATFGGCGGEAPKEPSAAPSAEAVPGEGRIDLRLDGQPYSVFHFSDAWDKPFLHPLSTPSGVVVTRGFPVVSLPAESQDHAWHRGIIWGHGLINGQDFWREQGRDKTSRFVPLDPPAGRAEGGSVIVEAKLDMLPPDGKSIGTCHQVYALRKTTDGIQIDARITISADRGQPIVFGDTEDGGFGFRFHDAFRPDHGALLLNSDGLAGAENIWGKRARWVQYSTQVGGKPASVSILDHPSNFRHPTYWHARDYGLCAANPFGLHDFLGDPGQDGSHTVEAVGEIVFRYRVVIADGVTAPPDVEGLFSAFAAT